MTMRIVVENTDTSRKAVLEVNNQTADGGSVPAYTITLEPGDKGEAWIHSTRFFTVKEIAEG